MPEQPRRILEKSRTVRRRYQRSNKRFQFTEEQIKQIEREEERERRAQKLREKEKKRIANKKKKAEKEAKARRERRRLGLPDPNVKISPSQQRLSSFFGMKKPPQEQKEEPELEDTELSSNDSDTENEVEGSSGSCSKGDIQSSAGSQVKTDAETGGDMRKDNNKENEELIASDDEGSVSDTETVVIDHEDGVNGNRRPEVNALRSAADPVQSLGNSFKDETSILLQDLSPEDLDTEEEEEAEREIKESRAAEINQTATETTRTAQPASKLVSAPYNSPEKRDKHEHLTFRESNPNMTHERPADTKHTEATAQKPSEPPTTEIYQDPEDVLACISTQDLADFDDDDLDDADDNKENMHPNISIPPGQRPPANLSFPRRPKPYNSLQAKAERQPLSTLNRELPPPSQPQFGKLSKSPVKLRQVSSPAVLHRTGATTAYAMGSPTRRPTPLRSVSGPGAITTKATASPFSDDDEFGDLDLTLEELEELGA